MENRIMHAKLLADIDGLQSLADDLRRLKANNLRASDLGEDLPSLERFRWSARKAPCLEGIVFGHPVLHDGDVILTSEVFAYFEEDGQSFVRTLNRWYRLANASLDRRLDA
jgi:hypothetical protein